MEKLGKLYIGTSGWVYGHWEGIFYPNDLPSKDKLKYYSQHFKTAEVNYSFYHLPRPATYQKWYSQTPADFIFAVKASKFITHIKRLKGVKTAWKTFLENALNLKEKLGPILFQFPPSFRATEDNVKRLENFLKDIRNKIAMAELLRIAMEFREKTWYNQKIYNLLKRYNVAWVIADSPRYPRADEVTADFIYIRMHGSQTMFSSKYTKKELSLLAEKIKKWQKQEIDIYCYFNNDLHGYAIENARELLGFLKR
ncbi:MAG: DUF72 domain-containing protein [Candidatus Nealsonbacteria bacterium]|nr:MAG: DUF72 domain-containing protein [Candidatus Nealsonbacteria bacterium]